MINVNYEYPSDALYAFCTRILDIPGIDFSKIGFTVPVEIGNKTITIVEHPQSLTIKYPDYDEVFLTKPARAKLNESVAEFARQTKRAEDEEIAQALIASMADKGFVYVENMSSETVDRFLCMWCDAYGEDSPAMFINEHLTDKLDEVRVTGFIKTHLTPEQIAAKNDEDGDDALKPDPMFPKEEAVSGCEPF